MDDPAASIENIIASRNIPLEQTMAGKIQSGVQNTGKGIKNLMGMLPTPSNLLNKFGIQNFNSLSPADQLFIKTNSGYRGPTVFGENTGGGNVDPFGRNVESLMGNYAEKVRSDFDKLSTNLSADGVIGSKDQYQGATFDPVTGTFKADDEDDIDSVNKAAYANKMNKMNLARYRFDKKAIEQQKKNQRDIDAKNAAEAATAAAANRAGQIAAERGADTTTSSGGRGSRRGAADISESSRGGFATDDTASFFSRGGRVSFKNGGLASIL